jgi:hypothetical protein
MPALKNIEYVKDKNGCWNVTSHIRSSYGEGYTRAHYNGRRDYIHRIFYEIHKGPIPKGMCVCHKCDNPVCINPKHMFLGTLADNVHDAQSKGRIRNSPKLNEASVRQIRDMISEGITQREIGAMFGVGFTTICEIAKRRNWAWLT